MNMFALCAVALLGAAAPMANVEPARAVRHNAVVSNSDPSARVVVPSRATYVGTDRWILFGIANCQLYAFVEADAHKHVRRLYWIQFEGYLPSMPRLHHEYDSHDHATMGGLDFYVDTWAGSSKPSKPDTKELAAIVASKGYAVPAAMNSGSDEEHLDALIAAKGYVLPSRLASVRFVHTLDEARKELMIIYSEALPGNRALTKSARAALIVRAEDKIKVEHI